MKFINKYISMNTLLSFPESWVNNIIFLTTWLKNIIQLIQIIKSSLFREFYIKLEYSAIKEKVYCILFVISLFTIK